MLVDNGMKAEEQYCYSEIVEVKVGCGCGGKKPTYENAYRVTLNGVNYDLLAKYVVEANGNQIACEDQDTMKRRENIGDTQNVNDFNPYRNNPNPDVIANSANNIKM